MLYKYKFEIKLIDYNLPANKTIKSINEIAGEKVMNYVAIEIEQTLTTELSPSKETASKVTYMLKNATEEAIKEEKLNWEILSYSFKSVEVVLDEEKDQE